MLTLNLAAIEYAYEHGILHRDISFGNVMISEEGRGILNDWDHSRADPRCHNPNDAAAGPPFRTVSSISLAFESRAHASAR